MGLCWWNDNFYWNFYKWYEGRRNKKVGIKNIGRGLNFITNITIDQCGYCGVWFDSISNVQISGNITRCGQYYYDVSYDNYLMLDNRVKEAYSLFYGNLLSQVI